MNTDGIVTEPKRKKCLKNYNYTITQLLNYTRMLNLLFLQSELPLQQFEIKFKLHIYSRLLAAAKSLALCS